MNTLQHFFDFINNHKKISIVIPSNPSGDIFFSSLAIQKAINEFKKDIQIPVVCTELGKFSEIDPELKKNILGKITLEKKWEFDLDISKNKIKALKYNTINDHLKITFSFEDHFIKPEKYHFSNLLNENLVISIGIKKKSDFLNIIELTEPDLKQISVINIDNQETNEKFGNLNVINGSTTIAELVYQLLKDRIHDKASSSDTLSFELSAFISATDQFKNSHDTPPLMREIADLIESGANLQKAFDITKLAQPELNPSLDQKSRINNDILENYI